MKFLKNEELGRPGLQQFRSQQKIPVTVVLDNVRSGLNVGSVFRSADSFNIELILLCGITSRPPERDILKSALGATESVAWKYFEKTRFALESLKEQGYQIYAVEQADPSIRLDLFKTDWQKKIAVIFGNEVKGVDPELLPYLDGCIEIPQSGTKHSLNIAVCAGIVLWTFYSQLEINNT